MAEDCGLSTLAATEAISRSRSGSSSGSSESDGSPLCKISPLVPKTFSGSHQAQPQRPLTPKKRHRMEVEQEARRQEAIRAAERAKAECEAMTLIDEREVRQDVALERVSEQEAETPDKPALTPTAKIAALAKDAQTTTTPNVTDGAMSTAKKRKAEPEPITAGKRRRSIPKKFADDEPSPTPPKVPKSTPAKAPKSTPSKAPTSTPTKAPTSTPTKAPKSTPTKAPKRTPKKSQPPPVETEAGDGASVPEGWRRILTQRMQGESAGKFDVYIWSPSGKKFRSRPQLMAYLEETGSPLSIDSFSFKHKGTSVTPARVKKETPPKKEKEKKPTKKAKAVTATTPSKRGRPRKNSGGQSPVAKTATQPRRSPSKAAAGKAKGKQQRKVMKPPPDTGSKKASRTQQLQKLLVKINFQKPGDIREGSSEESSEMSSEDDFDPGTTEEAEDMSDISLTPSPPSIKKPRRHSSPPV